MDCFFLRNSRHKMVACFMLLFMLEALHIAEQTSDEQCWEVSNQMNEIYGSFMLLNKYYYRTCVLAN